MMRIIINLKRSKTFEPYSNVVRFNILKNTLILGILNTSDYEQVCIPIKKISYMGVSTDELE